MKVDGHCHCGEIVFEAEVDPNTASICHCSDCQTLTGGREGVALIDQTAV
jgi:hypothetical protein